MAGFCNRTRVGRATLAFARSFAGSVTRVLHVLWLQITGCFFLLFALTCGGGAMRAYRDYAAGKTTIGHPLLIGGVAVLFAYFAISSFARARHKESAHRQKARTA